MILQVADWWENEFHQSNWQENASFLLSTARQQGASTLMQLSQEVTLTPEDRNAHTAVLFKLLLSSISVAGESDEQVMRSSA